MTDTKITEVSVYRSGMTVKRTAKIELEKGTQTVRFTGMPANADQSSLRLSVPEGISGSNVQVEYPTREEQQEKTEALRRQIERVGQAVSAREKQIGLWEANADFSSKENISVSEMTAYLVGLPKHLDALREEIDELNEQRKELNKQLKELQQAAAQPVVAAELTAPEAGVYPVEIRYRDYKASWTPVYEIHAEDEPDALILRLRAKVLQNTAEDWKDVKLTLCTGDPSVSGTIPVLDPLKVRFYVAPVVESRARNALMGGAMMKAAMAAPMAMEDGCVAEESVEYARPMAQVSAGSGQAVKGETMTEYELSGRWDLRRGQEIVCDIETKKIPCEYHVAACPRKNESAFLAAEVKTSALEDMQNTEAAVFLKGAFAGNVTLQPDMTEETYDLSLGRDETVKVKRTQKKRYTSTVLLKGQKKTEYEYEISAASRKDKPCRVTLTDQLPVSEEKTIVVETGTVSDGRLEAETGIVTWDFTLKPAESRTVRLAYSVAWPKDKRIEEVNTRR